MPSLNQEREFDRFSQAVVFRTLRKGRGDRHRTFVSSILQRFESLAAGKFTEFGMREHLDLADAFLADPQLLADLCQRLLGDAPIPYRLTMIRRSRFSS